MAKSPGGGSSTVAPASALPAPRWGSPTNVPPKPPTQGVLKWDVPGPLGGPALLSPPLPNPFVLVPPSTLEHPWWLVKAWRAEFPPGGPPASWWVVENGELEPYLQCTVLYTAVLIQWGRSNPCGEMGQRWWLLEDLVDYGEELRVPTVPPTCGHRCWRATLDYLNARWPWGPVTGEEEEEVALAQQALQGVGAVR